MQVTQAEDLFDVEVYPSKKDILDYIKSIESNDHLLSSLMEKCDEILSPKETEGRKYSAAQKRAYDIWLYIIENSLSENNLVLHEIDIKAPSRKTNKQISSSELDHCGEQDRNGALLNMSLEEVEVSNFVA